MSEEKERMLNRVMEQFGDQLVRLCYTYVRDWQTAEDLAQETFLRFYRAYENFRGEAALETYLYRIAVNVCHDYLASIYQLIVPRDVTEMEIHIYDERGRIEQ